MYISETHFSELKIPHIMMFAEEEGITLIIKKEVAENNSLAYSGIWGWIILTVHSDLSAVGFLAAITEKFTKSGVSVNVVSAYYHDHLFVPIDKQNEAMLLLEELIASQEAKLRS